MCVYVFVCVHISLFLSLFFIAKIVRFNLVVKSLVCNNRKISYSSEELLKIRYNIGVLQPATIQSLRLERIEF